MGAAGTVPAHGRVGAERGVGGAVPHGAPPGSRAGLAPLHHPPARAQQRVRATVPPRAERSVKKKYPSLTNMCDKSNEIIKSVHTL